MSGLIAVSVVACSGERATLKNAERRVAGVLQNMVEGRGTDDKIQTATCLWYANKVAILDLGALGRAADGFDEWRIEKGLYRGIDSFEILGSSFEGEPDDKVVIVRVTIDGEEHAVRVPEKRPLSWAD
jgi:hypothetical protein